MRRARAAARPPTASSPERLQIARRAREARVLEAAGGEPIERRLRLLRCLRGERGFQQDPGVGGLPLIGPILRGERKRASGVTEEFQAEARLVLRVEALAALVGCGVTRLQGARKARRLGAA